MKTCEKCGQEWTSLHHCAPKPDAEAVEPFVDTPLCCGRFWLRVCGIHVAMQGDLCRADTFDARCWDENELREAAGLIRAELERREREAFEAGARVWVSRPGCERFEEDWQRYIAGRSRELLADQRSLVVSTPERLRSTFALRRQCRCVRAWLAGHSRRSR